MEKFFSIARIPKNKLFCYTNQEEQRMISVTRSEPKDLWQNNMFDVFGTMKEFDKIGNLVALIQKICWDKHDVILPASPATEPETLLQRIAMIPSTKCVADYLCFCENLTRVCTES